MKTLKSWTLGLLTFVMCMGLAACSSNDDPSEEEQTQEELDGMVELLHLKQNLCRLNEKGEPVEAYFGKPYNASNPSERVYYTRSVSSAKSRFKLLLASSTPCSADGTPTPSIISKVVPRSPKATGRTDSWLLPPSMYPV